MHAPPFAAATSRRSHQTRPFGYCPPDGAGGRLREVTQPPINQRGQRSGRAPTVAMVAFVVFVVGICGIAAIGAGTERPEDTRDVARTGALAPPQTSAAETTPTTTSAAATTPPVTSPATTDPASNPATKAPTTTTTNPATKAPTKAPTTKATTKPAGNCNPNYTPCVPNDPVDVDCKGGSGNGPSYVQGPVRVIGDDVYDLDRDGDGIGCD